MRRYSGRSIVVKFGGNAMGKGDYLRRFASDIMLLRQVGATPVVVHGGGPQIGEMLDKLQIKSEFVDGLRVTDEAAINVVEMVLAGSVNKAIVAAIVEAGGRAVGISGKDGGLIRARKKMGGKPSDPVDLGFVGEPAEINPEVVNTLIAGGMIPVIAPVALGMEDNQTYNINADTVAGAISGRIQAARMLMLTNVPGVKDTKGELIPELTTSEARALIEDGTVSGGMIPKVETCIAAVDGGAEAAVILDGTESHAVLVELFTEHGVGTIIRKD